MRKRPYNAFLKTWLIVVFMMRACEALSAYEHDLVSKPLAPELEEPIVLMRYDRIHIDHASEVITVDGSVVVAYKGKQLFADHMSYDATHDVLWASGHVRVHESTPDILFGESIQLQDHWSKGWVQDVKALLADNARIAGLQGWKVNDTQYVLDQGIYSPCELCGPQKLPFWHMKAKRILDDRGTHDISYRHVRLEVGKIPILYSPYLRHAGPGVRRRSGLLVPSFLFSSQNGMGVQVPYYYTFSPQRDMTLTPITTQKGGHLLGLEWRQRWQHGAWTVTGSVMPTYKKSQTLSLDHQVNIRPFRGHVTSDFRHEINDAWVLSSNAVMTSDQTYLRRYPYFGHTNDGFLTSSGALEYLHRETYWGTKGYFFEPLAADTSFQTTPKIVPSVEYDTFLDPYGRWTQRSGYHVLNMKRMMGNQMTRVSVHHDWTGHYLQTAGLVMNPFVQLRADGYQTRLIQDAQHQLPLASQYPFYGTGWRAVPTLGLRFRWPLIASSPINHQHLFEPYAMVLTTPLWGSMQSRMPNEDTADFDLTPMNVFQIQPFQGLDHVQTGTRVQYGGMWTEHTQSGYRWTFEMGRIGLLSRPTFYRNAQDPPSFLPYTSHVGSVRYKAPQAHHGHIRFQSDTRSWHPKRWEMGWFWTPSVYQLQLRYAFGHAQKQPIITERFSTTTGTFQFPLAKELWRGSISSVINTNRRWQPLTQTAQIIYTNDCFTGLLSLQRTYYKDREVKPDTTFFLTLSFKNLGTFSTQTLDMMQDSLEEKKK